MTRSTVRSAISRIPAGAPSTPTTRMFITRFPTVCPEPDSQAK